MKTKHIALVVLFASGMSFAFGIVTQRGRVFPYSILNSVHDFIVPDIEDEHARTRIESPAESRARAIERLTSIGYVRGTFDADQHLRDVVMHDASRAFSGFNFYSSRSRESALLIDMTGGVVHEWNHDTPEGWQSAELLPNGDVLAIVKDIELVRLDSKSKLLWRFTGRVHHDLDVFDNRIYSLNRLETIRPEIHAERRTLVDVLSILTPDGVEVEQVSILDVLLDSPYAYILRSLAPNSLAGNGPALDVLHANHVELIPEGFESRSPAFKPGNIILSMRNIHTVMIVDPATHEVVWLWGPGNLTYQHHPSLLANDNLLIFDNGIERSRVVELDPVSFQIVWSYTADDFFSATRGSVQRLPNGNSLITSPMRVMYSRLMSRAGPFGSLRTLQSMTRAFATRSGE